MVFVFSAIEVLPENYNYATTKEEEEAKPSRYDIPPHHLESNVRK